MADVGSVRYEVELDDSKLDQQVGKTEKTIVSKLGGIVGKVGTGVAAGVGLTAGGIAMAGKAAVDMAGEVSKAGDEIDKMSQKIGISANAYQEWSYVFERSGADVNNLQAGMKTLSAVITDAGNGSKSAAEKLSAVGISLEEINGLSQEDQLALVIERLQGMGSGAERTAAATDLLGRSATDMAAVLNMTAEDTQALIDEAHNYGMVMSDEAVAASATYQDSLTKLQGTVGGLKNKLVAGLLPGLTQVVNGMADVANGSVSMEDAIDLGVTNIVTALDESLPDMIDRGVEIVTSVAEGIVKNLPKILDAAGKIMSKLIGALIELLPTLLDAALQIVAALATYIIQSLPGLAGAAWDAIKALAGYLVEHGPELLQAGVDIIAQVAQGIVNGITKIGESVGKVIDAIKDKFSGFDWGEIGGNIIDGLKNGITGAASRAGDAITETGGKIVDWGKKKLGIESPSKVFRDEVGAMIPAGIAEGIEDSSSLATGSLDRLIQDFTADVSYEVPRISDYAADLGASITATGSTEIVVPLIVDGREMARATAWYTNEQLAWEAR